VSVWFLCCSQSSCATKQDIGIFVLCCQVQFTTVMRHWRLLVPRYCHWKASKMQSVRSTGDTTAKPERKWCGYRGGLMKQTSSWSWKHKGQVTHNFNSMDTSNWKLIHCAQWPWGKTNISWGHFDKKFNLIQSLLLLLPFYSYYTGRTALADTPG